MKHTLRLLNTLLVLCLITTNLIAQDEKTSNFTFSGSVDSYFRANLNGSNDAADTLSTLAPATSFSEDTGFALGMVNLIAGYETEKIGFVADLVFGPRGEDAVFGSSAPNNILNQLNAFIKVSDATTITLGNFNTFLGYEVISPTANFHYSTSYLFSYGPFSHTGLKADFALSDEWSLMTAIMNPTDATDFNPTGEYVGGVQLGYSKDAGSAYVNGIFSDDFYQVDLTTGWDVSETVYAGLNASSSSDFYGAAVYLQAATSDAVTLGVRGEYFNDDSGVAIAENENVFDVTASANIAVGALTIIPEVRLDALSYDGYIYSDKSTILEGATDIGRSLSSFALAAVYAFD